MLKTFVTDSDIYYFDSENFTLSTSSIIVKNKLKKENDPSILKKS